MKKQVIIDENNLKKIIREQLQLILSEGIDIQNTNNQRTISVTNKHQNYADTNDYNQPYMFVDTQRGYTVYSVFQRKETKDGITDSNPLLNALKKRKGWEFANAKQDLTLLLRNFVSAIKLLPKYDTIIMTPSNNPLNQIVFNYLIRIIPHASSYTNFFEKYKALDVYENLIDENYINSQFDNPSKVYEHLDIAFGNMMKENGGIFSYKFLQKSQYRDVIIQSMKVNIGADDDLNYDEEINGKNVLIFDDTVTSGKTISYSGNSIYEMFAPKSLTFITLFTALNIEDSNQQKVDNII